MKPGDLITEQDLELLRAPDTRMAPLHPDKYNPLPDEQDKIDT
jgi:hypothetical protein